MSSSQQRFGTDFCKKKTWHVFNTLGSLFALRKRSPIDHLLSTTLVVAHDAHRNSGTTLLPHVVTSFKTISGTWLNQFSTFPTFLLISFICSSSCKMAPRDTPSTRRSISKCGFFVTSDSEFRTSFLELEWPGSSVVLPVTSLSPFSIATGFPEPKGTSLERVRSPFWEITL